MNIPAGQKIAWVIVCDQFIFLDIEKDRYFRLTEPANACALLQAAARGTPDWSQPPEFPRPADWQRATKSAFPLRDGRFSISGIAAAMWLEKRIANRLAQTGFEQTLLWVRTILDCARSNEPMAGEALGIASDFQRAHLLKSAAGKCLIQSLAMAVRCASTKVSANVVIGVRANPFAAHCWCQIKDMVLNDTLEEVRRFTPILVI